MGYIPPQNLENLKKYKYSGIDKSPVTKYILNPFWTWFVTLWPTTIAPNTITISGLGLVLINFMTMIYYDPEYLTLKGGASGPPQWIYFTWAIGLFFYQTFDAIDGKQARRTGMAGPLGEMFDHGCDALNTTLEAVLAAHALNMGRSWWTVASQLATLANFYLSTWEEYHTGTLYLGVFSGPVEGILMIVGIYIISGIYGPEVWDTGILTFFRLDNVEALKNIPNVGLNETFMIFATVGLLFNIVTSYLNVYTSMKAQGRPTVRPLLLLLPFPLSAAIQIAWLSQPTFASSFIVNSRNFLPFLCAWGLQFAHQVGRMILAHTTKTPFPLFDWIWIWSIIGAVDINLPRLFGIPSIIQTSELNTTIFVWTTLVISLGVYLRFCILVIQDITNYLGIACFTVRKRNDRGIWKVSGNDKKQK